MGMSGLCYAQNHANPSMSVARTHAGPNLNSGSQTSVRTRRIFMLSRLT
jgi:hypothetical protein